MLMHETEAAVGADAVAGHNETTRTSVPRIPPAALEAVRQAYLQGWQSVQAAALPTAAQPGNECAVTDKQFAAPEWQRDASARVLAALHQLNTQTMGALANAVQGEPMSCARLRFMVEQWCAAASPAHLFALNPQAQQAMIASQGATLQQGMRQLLGDMQIGRITQSATEPFVLGETLAATPGAVIAETDLFQLLQYGATTKTVFTRGLLIVPPCINKYYILDLGEHNSFVRHAVAAGHTVYMMSWRNPDASVAAKTWDDYVDAVLAAMAIVRDVSAQPSLNTLGFCIGGTLLACAAAVEAARAAKLTQRHSRRPVRAPQSPSIASMSLLTTMLDYSDTGVLDVFIDEAHVARREREIGGGAPSADGRSRVVGKVGLMQACDFANTFSMLRPRELVWNYVVDQYLLGRPPRAFDLLFWNGDSTHLPGPMFSWYLRQLYLENRLREPEALTVCGATISLASVTAPSFLYASRDDHIVPWKSAYASRALLGGESTFVLGASGHIAGVINPPAANKRQFWSQRACSHDGKTVLVSADDWLAHADTEQGSWWPTWLAWQAGHAGHRVAAPNVLGNVRYRPIEAAPGRYVKVSISTTKGSS